MTTQRPAVERTHPPAFLMKAVNPLTRRLIARGKASDALLVLHYTGRKSGTAYDVPAGYHLIDGQITVFTNSAWRHNFTGGRDITVTLRGERTPAGPNSPPTPTRSPTSTPASSPNSAPPRPPAASASASTWTAPPPGTRSAPR